MGDLVLVLTNGNGPARRGKRTASLTRGKAEKEKRRGERPKKSTRLPSLTVVGGKVKLLKKEGVVSPATTSRCNSVVKAKGGRKKRYRASEEAVIRRSRIPHRDEPNIEHPGSRNCPIILARGLFIPASLRVLGPHERRNAKRRTKEENKNRLRPS